MDLFQGLNLNNTQGKHAPADIIAAIQDIFNMLDPPPVDKRLPPPKGAVTQAQFIDGVSNNPHLLHLFWNLFELPIFVGWKDPNHTPIPNP